MGLLTEKVIELGEVLACSLDVLIKGAAADGNVTNGVEKIAYDSLMNGFSKYMSLAIGLILFGTSMMVGLSGFGAPYERYGLVVLLLFVAIGVPIIVMQGIKLGIFRQRHPKLENFYTQAEIDKYGEKFVVITASAVGIIFGGNDDIYRDDVDGAFVGR